MTVVNTTEVDILEDKVTLFLQRYAKDDSARDTVAPYLAKISLEMNHLYTDLGFSNRAEVTSYMQDNFPILAMRKPVDKVWKKFIYDSIGEVAPACVTCKDQKDCWEC